MNGSVAVAPALSFAVTRTSSVPIDPIAGVPESIPLAVLIVSQAGSTAPLASFAL